MKIEITSVPTLVLQFAPGDFRRATLCAPARYTWIEHQPNAELPALRELTVLTGTRYNGVGPGNSPFVWLLEMVCPRWGRALHGALPHDQAHETRFTAYPDVSAARKYADQLFLAIMLATLPKIESGNGWRGVLRRISTTMERGLCWVDAWIKYYTVRSRLGAGVWNAHDKEFSQ